MGQGFKVYSSSELYCKWPKVAETMTEATEFTRYYKSYPLALYCFFEGEDSKYYGIRIKTIAMPDKYFFLSCGGKDGVLKIHQIISSEEYYKSSKAAYFIDRDFGLCHRFGHLWPFAA
jgi:hypothetical protein